MIQIVIENISIMFVYILIGYMLRRQRVMDEIVTKGLSYLLLKIAIPATIINATTSQPFAMERLANMGIMLGFSVVFFMGFTLLAWVIAKMLKMPANRQGVFAIAAGFSNVAFMGIPIISSIWGNAGVFYLSLVNIPFFVCLGIVTNWMLGPDPRTVGKSRQFRFRLDLNITVAIIGLSIYLAQDTMPVEILHVIRPTVVDGVGGGVIGRLILQLSQLTTPVSMFVIGSSLGGSRLSDMPRDRSVYTLLLISLLLFPVLVALMTGFITDETLRGVLIMKTAMPSATLIAIFADERQADGLYASQVVLLTTVFSLLSIPLITFLI